MGRGRKREGNSVSSLVREKKGKKKPETTDGRKRKGKGFQFYSSAKRNGKRGLGGG